LSPVALDEVLDFRRQHGAEHRAYARDLRHFVHDLATLDRTGRDQALADRREALADAADQHRPLARTSWRRPLATFGLGVAGSAVSLAAGNPVAAGLGAASALLGLRRQADPASVYTYLFPRTGPSDTKLRNVRPVQAGAAVGGDRQEGSPVIRRGHRMP